MIHVVNPSLIVHPSDVSPSGASNRGGASVFLCVGTEIIHVLGTSFTG